MSSTESPISVTVKTAAGSLVTVRADNADEFEQIVALGLAALADSVKELETAIRGTPAPVVNTGTPLHPSVGMAAAILGGTIIESNAIGASRMCPHGSMTRIAASTGKFGPYKGYFCPAQQGDATKCATQYIKPNHPEWNTFVADVNK